MERKKMTNDTCHYCINFHQCDRKKIEKYYWGNDKKCKDWINRNNNKE